MACVLMEILNIRRLKENRNRAITSINGVAASPIRKRQAEFNRKAKASGTLVSNLETSHPDRGNPIRELTGIVRRMVPSSASFRCRAALIVGIRDAQLEKLNPERKKKILSETRSLLIDCIMLN